MTTPTWPEPSSLRSQWPETISVEELRYSLVRRRTSIDALATLVLVTVCGLALLPLASVLYMLLARGGASLSWALFTELTPPAGADGGGIGNGILGTLVIAGVAAAASLAPGVLAAIYLAEYGGTSRLAAVVRFSGRVLTGLPSVLAGVFAYAVVVSAMGSFSALAGGLALGVLMLPIVMLTAEEALRMVPADMRLAALGMGATRAQLVWRVVVPRAMPSIVVGVILALARAMGETAPLLFTALFSDYWFEGRLGEPIASLAVLIYNFSGSPFGNQVELAWAAALVLVGLVLVLSTVAQLLIKRTSQGL